MKSNRVIEEAIEANKPNMALTNNGMQQNKIQVQGKHNSEDLSNRVRKQSTSRQDLHHDQQKPTCTYTQDES